MCRLGKQGQSIHHASAVWVWGPSQAGESIWSGAAGETHPVYTAGYQDRWDTGGYVSASLLIAIQYDSPSAVKMAD